VKIKEAYVRLHFKAVQVTPQLPEPAPSAGGADFM
jgi:hypothetical protein